MPHLRIVTYNVHGFVGMDGRRRTFRPLEVLRHIAADVVAIQEFVDLPAPGHESLLECWSRSLGLPHYRFAPAFERGGETFGNVLLSRFPVDRWREHDFSAPGCLRRVTLQGSVGFGDTPLTFTVVHLGVRVASRAPQRLLLRSLIEGCGNRPHVVLGDFNEWHPWNRTFQLLRENFSAGPALPSFPAVAPALALDRIWFRPRHQAFTTHVVKHSQARIASDHLPVVSVLEPDGPMAAG